MSDKNVFKESMELFTTLTENNYEERFVAFVDILGSSRLFKTSGELKELAPLFSSLQLIKNGAERTEKLTLTRFSDSIFVVAQKECFLDLIDFLSCCSVNLLTLSSQRIVNSNTETKANEYMNCQLLRGGVCYGRVFSLKKYLKEHNRDAHDFDDLVIGPAVPKAYELESKSAKYPRIIFDENTIKVAITSEKWNELINEKILVKDCDGIMYLDCIEFLRRRRDADIFQEDISNKCINWAREKADLYKDNEMIYEKYDWLIHYLNNKIR